MLEVSARKWVALSIRSMISIHHGKLLASLIMGFLPEPIISHFGEVFGNMTRLNNRTEPLSVVFAIGYSHIFLLFVGGIVNPNISFPHIIHP